MNPANAQTGVERMRMNVGARKSRLMRWSTVATSLTCAALALNANGCSRQDARLEQHRKSFESLGATTVAIVDAWLNGQTSGTYTRAALAKTFQLVEQERTALARAPEALRDPRGASLSQSAERLSRLLAAMDADVAAANGASARQHEAEIPFRPADQP